MKAKKSNRFSVLYLLAAGAVLGLMVSMLGQIPALAHHELAGITTSYGYWAVISGIITVHSSRPWKAGLCCTAFFAAMVVVYYAFAWYVTGVFPWQTVLWWLILAAIGFGWGFVVWYHHQSGWLGSFVAALPLTVVAVSIWNILVLDLFTSQSGAYISLVVFGLFVIYFFIFAAQNMVQRLRMLLFTVILTLLWQFGIASWLFDWLGTL